MKKRLAACVILVGAGCALNPAPPAQTGGSWDRHELLQGPAPDAFETPRGELTLTRNVRSNLQPLSSSFRYAVDLDVESASGGSSNNHDVRCAVQRDDSYACRGPTLLDLRLSADCTRGEVQTPAGSAVLEPWFVRADGSTAEPWATGDTHVGFVLRRQGRSLAAFDTDHPWARIVWVDHAVSEAERPSLDALGVILDDLIEAGTQFVGPTFRPLLCDRLVTLRRYPR
jgi:hypothetical protein